MSGKGAKSGSCLAPCDKGVRLLPGKVSAAFIARRTPKPTHENARQRRTENDFGATQSFILPAPLAQVLMES
jgi:hypothetical protein